MNVKTTLPISEVRKNIFKIVGDTKKPGIYYTITDKGRPASVIMSAEEFESWQETLEVMRDFPSLDKDIKEAEKEYKKGNYITLEELLAEEGFVLATKNKKYVSGNRAGKGSKKSK